MEKNPSFLAFVELRPSLQTSNLDNCKCPIPGGCPRRAAMFSYDAFRRNQWVLLPRDNRLYGNQTNESSKQLERQMRRKTKQKGCEHRPSLQSSNLDNCKCPIPGGCPRRAPMFPYDAFRRNQWVLLPRDNRLYGNQTNESSKQLESLIRRQNTIEMASPPLPPH